MDIEYRNLGSAGVKVSPICLGAMMFGKVTEEPDAHRIIHHALDHGINFIDTANVYGQGASEEVVGRAIKGRRGEVVLATKVHGKRGDGPNDRGNSRRHILLEVENSLRRLDTDWIDLYQLHRHDPDTPLEETLSALDDLVRQGKVRYIGVSEFPAWVIAKMAAVSKREHLAPVVCNQPQYNILRRGLETEVLPCCVEHGIAIIPWSPLAGGLLTGKYKRGQEPPPDSRGARNPNLAKRLDGALHDTLDKLQVRAEALGKSLGQYAMAWLLAHPAVTAPIAGPRTLEQWEDNLGALGWEFPEEDKAYIDELTEQAHAAVAIQRF